MSSALRGIAPFVVLIFIALASMGVVGGVNAGERGIPKSAPAFTKFVAGFIQEAMPQAKVTITGPLQLDVEVAGVGHATELNNIYSICRRNRDTCVVDVTVFVAEVVVLCREPATAPTRSALRIVVRPSVYVDRVRRNAKRNRPLAAPLVGDYWMIAIIDGSTTRAVADEDDLGALGLTAKDALALAVDNTRKAIRHSLRTELAKGSARGMLGGNIYASSTFAFPDLWASAAHAVKDNLLVAVPEGGIVLYADGNKPGALKSIRDAADAVVAHGDKPSFPDTVFRWSPTGWVAIK